MLAVFMANVGGAWDNAKKYIKEGYFGGKGSDAHKASVNGHLLCELHPKSWTKKEDFFTGVRSSSEGLRKKQPRLITKNRMDINMKWWQIQFPEEETSSTPLAISPDGKKTLIDWMEAIESNRRFPFQYRLSPKMSLDDYIADDLGVPLFSEQVRNIIDELMTGEEGIEWYEVSVVQSRNQYRYFAPKFTRTLDILNEDSSLYGVNKSILIKAVLSAEKIKKYSIVPIVGSSEAFFFPTRIAISDRVKKALKKS